MIVLSKLNSISNCGNVLNMIGNNIAYLFVTNINCSYTSSECSFTQDLKFSNCIDPVRCMNCSERRQDVGGAKFFLKKSLLRLSGTTTVKSRYYFCSGTLSI
jgi:hypothetical protein